jgi:hypothetical protein
MAAVGAAADLVDAWRLSQGEPVSEGVIIPMERLIFRARQAATPSDIEGLFGHVSARRGHLIAYGDALARNASTSGADYFIDRLGEDLDNADYIRGGLAGNPYLSLEQAARVLAALRRDARRYDGVRTLLKWHPGLLTDAYMAEMTADLDIERTKANIPYLQDMAAVMVDCLLPKGGIPQIP